MVATVGRGPARGTQWKESVSMTNVTGDIAVAWNAHHGAAGPLGAPTADAVVTNTGRLQRFENGIIATSKYGAHAIWGQPSALYALIGGTNAYHLAGDP